MLLTLHFIPLFLIHWKIEKEVRGISCRQRKEKGLSIGSSKKKILIKYYYERIRRDVTNFIKWMLLAILTGLVVGGASSAFAACISAATEYRNSHLWVFLCLPLAGIVIVFMYERLGRQDGGTNQVLSTIKSKDNVPFISAPLIFISTLLTHLTGVLQEGKVHRSSLEAVSEAGWQSWCIWMRQIIM